MGSHNFPARCCLLVAGWLLFSGAPFAQYFDNALPRISTGVVVPEQKVVLAARIMGRIESIPYTEGQTVKKGEVLIKLDDAELIAELRSAQASVNLAKTELQHLLRREVRLTRLYKTKSVSEDMLDDATFSASTANAKLSIAESAVTKIEVMLEETVIRAPFDAVITSKQAEVGTVTQPGAGLLKLENHDNLRFRTQVKERDIPHLEIGNTVTVTINALDDLALEGKIEKLIPSGDINTHAFTIEIGLPKREGLFPGMFGKISF